MERTSSAKLDEMLNLQKSAFDQTNLGYDFSVSSIATSSTTAFVPPANNVETENNDVKNELASENVDKGKSILGAPLSLIRKRLRTLGLRRETLRNPNRKRNIFFHLCGVIGHTQPNCYKWLTTQKSNSVILS